MKTLFDLPESPSPRLIWIEKNGIELHSNFYDEWEDKHWPWMACVPYKQQGFGDNKDDALRDLAVKLKIPLWNQ